MKIKNYINIDKIDIGESDVTIEYYAISNKDERLFKTIELNYFLGVMKTSSSEDFFYQLQSTLNGLILGNAAIIYATYTNIKNMINNNDVWGAVKGMEQNFNEIVKINEVLATTKNLPQNTDKIISDFENKIKLLSDFLQRAKILIEENKNER